MLLPSWVCGTRGPCGPRRCPCPHQLVEMQMIARGWGGDLGPWRVSGLWFIMCSVGSEGDGREVAEVAAVGGGLCLARVLWACPSLFRVLPLFPAVLTGRKAGIPEGRVLEPEHCRSSPGPRPRTPRVPGDPRPALTGSDGRLHWRGPGAPDGVFLRRLTLRGWGSASRMGGTGAGVRCREPWASSTLPRSADGVGAWAHLPGSRRRLSVPASGGLRRPACGPGWGPQARTQRAADRR